MNKENRITTEYMPRVYFNRGYAQMLMYLRDHPEANVPEEQVLPDGFPLGRWLKEVRTGLKNNTFQAKQKTMLEALGISCEKKYQSWESMYLKAMDYYARTGDMNISVGYCTEDGVLLGAWVDRQRRCYATLQKEQREKLSKLGIGKYSSKQEIFTERR